MGNPERAPDIEIIHADEWDPEEIIDLYRAGGWWKEEYDPAGMPALIRGSSDFVIALDRRENRAVGMGRLISDGASDGYIQDLVVLPDRRNMGVGEQIAGELVRSGKDMGLTWIGLIAEEGSEKFYNGLGFKPFKGTPMLYERKGARSGD